MTETQKPEQIEFKPWSLKKKLITAGILAAIGLGATYWLCDKNSLELTTLGTVVHENKYECTNFAALEVDPKDPKKAAKICYELVVKTVENFPQQEDVPQLYRLNIKPSNDRPLEFMANAIGEGSKVIFPYIDLHMFSGSKLKFPHDRMGTISADDLYVVQKEGDEKQLEDLLTKQEWDKHTVSKIGEFMRSYGDSASMAAMANEYPHSGVFRNKSL